MPQLKPMIRQRRRLRARSVRVFQERRRELEGRVREVRGVIFGIGARGRRRREERRGREDGGGRLGGFEVEDCF